MFNLGVIGFSEGNGHPFSFSAIINGYDERTFSDIGWPVIHRYLKRQRAENFGIKNLRVTHVWLPEDSMARKLSAACGIPTVVDRPQSMLDEVDGVLILRDDWSSHMPLAKMFLEEGIPVFIDKPLTLDETELSWFLPFVEKGKLMTCAGLRYAIELDSARYGLGDYGGIRSISCKVTNDWERYGVHMIDAIFSVVPARPISIHRPISESSDIYWIDMDDGSYVTIEPRGNVGPLFNVSIVGREKVSSHDLLDNFSSFSRLLGDFSKMLSDGKPPISPKDVEIAIKTLIAGRNADVGDGVILIP